jgi:dihydroorotase
MPIAPMSDHSDRRSFSHNHLLGIADLTAADIETILNVADGFADLNARREPPARRSLRDKAQINLFFENSTRTQASFELAGKRLGATTMNMAVPRSSVSKGETLLDTATTLNAMLPDILIVRHPHSGAVRLLAEHMNCAVINAGDGRCEHPTQALLDALTMRRAFRSRRGVDSEAAQLRGLTIAICGDIAHSRVARSNIFLHQKFGNRVRVCGPPSLAPSQVEALGVERCRRIREAVDGADVVMMLRLQSERMSGAHIASLREFYHGFGLDDGGLTTATSDAIVMHPGPMNRGVEIESELADDHRRSVIATQVEMGVAVRMAVLELVADNLPHRPNRVSRGRQTPPPGRFAPSVGAPTPGEKGGRPTAYVNALLVDPEAAKPRPGAVLVIDGEIADVVAHASVPSDAQVIDCKGAALAPGVVDMRVFIGEPGARPRESFGSGGEAAVAGGVTTIVTQPATNPVVDDPSVLQFIHARVRDEREDHAMPRVRTMAAMTKGLLGEEIAEHMFLKEAGAVALSDGGRPVRDSLVLRRCFESAASLGMLAVCDPQDPTLTAGACATEGAMAFRLGLPASPALAEAIGLERDLAIAALSGVRYHAAQISTAAALDPLRRARERGVDVTAAISATHFVFHEEDIGDYRTFLKLAPPLRAAEDRDAMIDALARGDIDCIVSSHLPQTEESKRVPFEEAAPGGVGLETLLLAGLELNARAGLGLCKLFQKLSLNPAKRLGLDCGRLSRGAPADLTLFDPTMRQEVNRRMLRSKSKNSPFDRRMMNGQVLRAIVAGRMVFVDDAND